MGLRIGDEQQFLMHIVHVYLLDHLVHSTRLELIQLDPTLGGIITVKIHDRRHILLHGSKPTLPAER